MIASGAESIFFLILPVAIALAVVSLFWRRSRSLSIIDQWAVDNGYELVRAEPAYLTTAFFFRRGKGQTIYSVVVRDTSGTIRTGKVLCGGYFGGLLLSDRAVVKWDN